MHTFDLEMLSPNLMQQCTEYSQFYSKLNSYMGRDKVQSVTEMALMMSEISAEMSYIIQN